MSVDETLEIKCPKCGKRHKYGLAVERSLVLGARPSSAPSANPTIYIHKFTCLFTCPVKDEGFQITIKLKETDSNRIQAVRVEGIVKGRRAQG